MAIFKCTECGFHSPTDDKNLGKTATCPKCRQKGRVSAEVEPSDALHADPEKSDGMQDPPGEAPQSPTINLPPPRPAAMPFPTAATRPPLWALSLIAVAFLLCAVATFAGGGLFVMTLSSSESAVQQGATGAVFAAGFVAVYVLARCVEKIVNILAMASRS